MPTWPGTTGDVVTSTMWNGLPAFTVQTAKTADYTAASGDEYQQLVQMNKLFFLLSFPSSPQEDCK